MLKESFRLVTKKSSDIRRAGRQKVPH